MRRLGLIFLIFLLFIAAVNSIEYSLLATVTINPIYSLSLEVKALKDSVWSGQDIPVSVSLSKTSLNVKREEKITVELEYNVTKDGNPLTSGSDTIDVRTKKTKVIKIPTTDADSGMYTVKVTASHPHAEEVVDSDDFIVRKKIVKMSMNFLEPLAWFFQFLNL